MGEHVGRGTIEDRADEASSERGLLPKVLVSHDSWSAGIIGPRPFPGVKHGLDVCGERRKWVWGEGEWVEK